MVGSLLGVVGMRIQVAEVAGRRRLAAADVPQLLAVGVVAVAHTRLDTGKALSSKRSTPNNKGCNRDHSHLHRRAKYINPSSRTVVN